MASLDSGTDNMIIYGCPPFVVAAKTLEPCIIIASFSAFMALIISSYARQLRSLSRLLFKHQHLNASPYGFAGAYRQCRCVITVCTRKSPFCHKVCNFNKIYCPFFRCNINKDNVHKSIISWSRSVHEKRCIGVSIKLNIYRKCWKISNINEDITILSTFYFYKHSSLKINSVNFQFMRSWIRIQIQVAFYISARIYRNKTWLHFFNIYN